MQSEISQIIIDALIKGHFNKKSDGFHIIGIIPTMILISDAITQQHSSQIETYKSNTVLSNILSEIREVPSNPEETGDVLRFILQIKDILETAALKWGESGYNMCEIVETLNVIKDKSRVFVELNQN